MSRAFDKGDPRPAPSGESTSEPAPQPPVGSRMLDQILALTEGGSANVGFVEPDDLRAMREVAQKFAGQPFSLKPVVMEMMHAILQIQLQKAEIPAATVRHMAEYIASTLYEDPPSRQRLETLWASLSQRQG